MKENIPYFEDEPLKEGVPTVERDNVEVVLFDPVKKQVLSLDWEKFGWKTIIIGGLDGDTPEIAAQKEILEETGYKNVRYVKEIAKVQAGYYAAHKKENRIANTTGLLFELVDNEREEVDLYELEKHISHWIPFSEVSEYLNLSSQKYLWDLVKDSLIQ